MKKQIDQIRTLPEAIINDDFTLFQRVFLIGFTYSICMLLLYLQLCICRTYLYRHQAKIGCITTEYFST